VKKRRRKTHITKRELAELIKPNRAVRNHLLAFIDDKQEALGALERRGMSKGEAAILMMLGYIENHLVDISMTLNDEPSDGDDDEKEPK